MENMGNGALAVGEVPTIPNVYMTAGPVQWFGTQDGSVALEQSEICYDQVEGSSPI